MKGAGSGMRERPGLSVSEGLAIQGEVYIEIRRRGKLVGTWHDQNMVMLQGKANIAKLFAGETGFHATHVGFGTNPEAASPDNADLENKVVKEISEKEYHTPTAVRCHFELEEDDAVGMNIREFGLFCADGTLFSRRTRPEGLQKTDQESIRGYWQIRFA